MKIYTDTKQSEKLVQLLSTDCADGVWVRYAMRGDGLDVPDEMQFIHCEIPFKLYSGIGIPSWSIVALLNSLSPATTLDISEGPDKQYRIHCKERFSEWHDNPIDACYEIILKLH